MEQSQNTISKKMHAGPYPQKKDVDSIALNDICIHLRLRPENVVAQTPYLNPTGLYDPTKDKSILAVTYHLNGKQKSINFQSNHCISQSHTFRHRRFCTQTLLHTDTFTRRCFCTQTLLHTDAFAHRRFYTQTPLHTDAFTYRSFYTQRLLNTEAFTHRSFYTQRPDP